MSHRRRGVAGRDQHASAFAGVLTRLCDAVPAVAAALVDPEGETVDYAGALDPFDIKVAAAEWTVIASMLRASRVPSWPETEQIVVRGAEKSFLIELLSDGYAVVLELPRRAFGGSERALGEAVRDLCAEAGLALPARLARVHDRYQEVEVRTVGRRPAALWLEGAWHPVEVLGHWRETARPRGTGYRARLASGAEITLVHEALGRWYTDTVLGARRGVPAGRIP